MKKIILFSWVLLISVSVFAKKVKFAVDMTGQTVSPNGVHISGDFQTVAGFSGGDWNSATCAMLQEGSSEIYSIVVDIPAFQKYEYRIINGDLFYESEFVPVESRVGYDFNDNRWIYIDSLANDTTFVGAILFGGNAPEGKKLVRLLVDMTQESVSTAGVYAAGSFNGWDYTSAALYNFEGNIYEVIQYMPEGSYAYKFANGHSSADAEPVPSACATNGSRAIDVVNDTVLPAVCFAYCTACGTGIADILQNSISIYPNPSNDKITISLNQAGYDIRIFDARGALVYEVNTCQQTTLSVDNLLPGTYTLQFSNFNNHATSTLNFVVQ